jgi:hypothetical protein
MSCLQASSRSVTSDCSPTRNRRQALALCRTHLSATTPDINALLTEQQKSALSRSCPQCKYGTLHVVARHVAVEPANSCAPLACAHIDSS